MPIKKRSGRNNQGRITVRHRGGGHKRRYRLIDFDRKDKENIEGIVSSVEYDPNRSAFIILVTYKDVEKIYHIAPQGIKVEEKIMLAKRTKLKPGNRMLIQNIPLGFDIFNIEIKKGKGGQMIRSAGTSAKVISQEDPRYTQIKLPSG